MRGIHWIRALLYGLCAEVLIGAISVPLAKGGFLWTAVYSVPILSFCGMFLFGFLLARRVESPVLHGALVGCAGVLLYLVLLLLPLPPPPVQPSSSEQQALAQLTLWLWPVAHALKILGGTLGGWLAERQVVGKVYQMRRPVGT